MLDKTGKLLFPRYNGKVTRHYILNGIQALLSKYRIDHILKNQTLNVPNLSPYPHKTDIRPTFSNICNKTHVFVYAME